MDGNLIIHVTLDSAKTASILADCCAATAVFPFFQPPQNRFSPNCSCIPQLELGTFRPPKLGSQDRGSAGKIARADCHQGGLTMAANSRPRPYIGINAD